MYKEEQIKSPFLTALVFFISAVVFLALFLVSLGDYYKSKITYDDLIYREFTVDEVIKRNDPEMGYSYYISVCETEKRIFVNNLLTKRAVIEGLDSLEKGDKIFCYLIERSSNYDAVEIKHDAVILSLEEYNDIYRNNSLLGLIVMPIGFILFIAFSIKYLFIYINKR